MTSKSNVELIDPRIKRELEQDFRRLKKYDSPALNFKDWIDYKTRNRDVVNLETFARSILSKDHKTSLRSIIRILDKFSGATVKIQKEVVEVLLTNNRWIKPEIRLKSKGGKLELDLDDTYLSLIFDEAEDKPRSNCYQ